VKEVIEGATTVYKRNLSDEIINLKLLYIHDTIIRGQAFVMYNVTGQL